jgi:hypothetical protein
MNQRAPLSQQKTVTYSLQNSRTDCKDNMMYKWYYVTLQVGV